MARKQTSHRFLQCRASILNSCTFLCYLQLYKAGDKHLWQFFSISLLVIATVKCSLARVKCQDSPTRSLKIAPYGYVSPSCYKCIAILVQVLWYEFCKSHPNAILPRHSEETKCATNQRVVASLLCNLFLITWLCAMCAAVPVFQSERVRVARQYGSCEMGATVTWYADRDTPALLL